MAALGEHLDIKRKKKTNIKEKAKFIATVSHYMSLKNDELF